MAEIYSQLQKYYAEHQYVADTMLFASGPLSALVAAKCGFKTYLNYEIIVSFIYGITMMIYPNWVLRLQVSALLI
jgi:hypothetical protein